LHEKEIDEGFHLVYEQVIKYVKAITYRKLRFIAKSTNVELSDIHSELLFKVVQSYYKMYPTDKPFNHVVNYLCRVVHNHAMNFISSSTSLKRGRLVNLGLGTKEDIFALTVVSENQLNTNVCDGEEIGYDQMAGTNPILQFELEFSVSQLLDKYKSKTKKYRMLTLLMGTPDNQFVEWLRARKHLKAQESNTDLQIREPDRYRELVISFLGVSRKGANVFLLGIGNKLGYNVGESYGLRKAA